MNWLPLIAVALFIKNFTPRKGGTGSENLISLLKLAATCKESGVFDLLKKEHPVSALLSGDFPIENLMGVFSTLMKNTGETPNEAGIENFPFSEELTGEEMGAVLQKFLNEKDF